MLAKELDNVRQEKDAYKLMAEQLREKYHSQKRKYEDREKALGLSLDESDPLSERRSQSLAQILCETREQNRKAEEEIKTLKQKLTESEGDMKILRENIARQRVGDEGVGMRHFPAHERETLVAQLESAREQVENLERDMVAKIDELQEHVTERDFFRRKADHLNEELNYVLGGNEKRIVDIDALLMENKYLKERLTQVQEEKSHAQATAAKYKGALEKRKGRGFLKSHSGNSLVLSQKQVENLLGEHKAGSLPVTSSTVSDLHSLSRALLETIHDKNVAINHQRNTNKILGKRVEELENKLKTLEVAGLWNLPTARTAALKAWQAEMSPDTKEALVPHQVSVDSSDLSESFKSDLSSEASTPQHSKAGVLDAESQSNHSPQLEDHKPIVEEENHQKMMTAEETLTEEQGGHHSETAEETQETASQKPEKTNHSSLEIDSHKPETTSHNSEHIESNDTAALNGESFGGKALVEAGKEDGNLVQLDNTEEGNTGGLSPSEDTSPRADKTESSADAYPRLSSPCGDGIDALESLFDTVAEKLVQQKSSQSKGGGDREDGKANHRTPLLPSSLSQEKNDSASSPSPSSPEKAATILVDTSPQCV